MKIKAKSNYQRFLFVSLFALVLFAVQIVSAQTNEFTYQGKLTDNSLPANANYDFFFSLHPDSTTVITLGAAQSLGVPVANGVFTVKVDFGAANFNGPDRWMEIRVKPAGSPNPSTVLTPRQQITSAPYSVRSLSANTATTATNATTANNSLNLGGVAANQYVVTSDSRLSDARNPLAGSGSYIQNQNSSPQASSSFNISGNGTVGGTLTANFHSGNGSGLTTLNAANIASGFLSDGRLSSNVALENATNIFSANQTINANLTQTGTITNLTLANGFVTSGTLGSGTIPVTGAGTRMMFYPKKAALRAGVVFGNQWDDANVGNYSIAMGRETTASGENSTAVGFNAVASGDFSTAMGLNSTASGTASTAIGQSAIASGGNSVAMGHNASTNNQEGSFVYGDITTTSAVNSISINSWTIRASGGYRFFSNSALTTGVSLSAGGGAWNNLSDRNAKENFAAVNSRNILRGVLGLPISTWNYKGQPQFRHLGPMAQDFSAAFKVGESDTTITTVDPDGVALAAIQGLFEELKDRDVKIDQLQQQMKQQQMLVENLQKLVCQQNPQAEVCKQDK